MTEQLVLNCIHLTRREDREVSILREAKSQGLYLRFWEGIEIRTDRKQGICLSHKAIVKNAKECGMKMVAICEDDLIFNKSPDGKLAWEYFLEQIPEDFDLFFSMCYVGVVENNRLKSVFSGMTMYVVHERFYDFFLSLPDSCHIDRELGLYANQFKYLVCEKFCCFQDGSKSDNNFMTCDYTPYLAGRKIYGKD